MDPGDGWLKAFCVDCGSHTHAERAECRFPMKAGVSAETAVASASDEDEESLAITTRYRFRRIASLCA